jgi:hypothetical protein
MAQVAAEPQGGWETIVVSGPTPGEETCDSAVVVFKAHHRDARNVHIALFHTSGEASASKCGGRGHVVAWDIGRSRR